MKQEIRPDRSFPRVFRRVAEEALRFQSQQFSDKGSSLTSVREAESILQMLAEGNGDAEAFAALESDSDSEESVQSHYKSSHDTPNGPEDDESDGSRTPEPMEELPLVPGDRQSPNRTKCTPTPPPEKAEDRITTPPTEKAEYRTPTLPAEEAKDRTPSPPPTEQENAYTPPEKPCEDDTMLYPYQKYRNDPDAEAHVYAFLQTWEENHVSQRLTGPEAEWSKIAEFGMTLEGPAARLHAKHLPDSFSMFEAQKQSSSDFSIDKWSNGNSSANSTTLNKRNRRSCLNSLSGSKHYTAN